MLARFSKGLLILALVCTIGLHWAFLQSVAWVGMVMTYSRSLPLAAAIDRTFDGKHPCCLCMQVQEGKRSEKKSERRLELKKLEFRFSMDFSIPAAPSAFFTLRYSDPLADSANDEPPFRPPRPSLEMAS